LPFFNSGSSTIASTSLLAHLARAASTAEWKGWPDCIAGLADRERSPRAAADAVFGEEELVGVVGASQS
jgi:hypothetical protein